MTTRKTQTYLSKDSSRRLQRLKAKTKLDSEKLVIRALTALILCAENFEKGEIYKESNGERKPFDLLAVISEAVSGKTSLILNINIPEEILDRLPEVCNMVGLKKTKPIYGQALCFFEELLPSIKAGDKYFVLTGEVLEPINFKV